MGNFKKYVFTGETKHHFGSTLHRIKRLKDGLIGGWIENEHNLSHYGDCFVYGEAMVYNFARVTQNAKVYDNVEIYDLAGVYENATIYGNTEIYGNAKVGGRVKLYGTNFIRGNAEISGNVVIEKSLIYGNAMVYDNVCIEDSVITGNAELYGNLKLSKTQIETGEIQIPFKEVETYHKNGTRSFTVIKTLEDKYLFNIGCQKLITKEEFIHRIHNTNGGLEKNPHREYYLKILSLY